MAASSAASHAPLGPILAFAANARYVGGAVLLPARQVPIVFCRRNLQVDPAAGLAHWMSRYILKYRPMLVVATPANAPCAVAGCIDRIVEIFNVSSLQLSEEDIASALGTSANFTAIRRDVLARYPTIASHLGRHKGRRSDRVRYWEAALVAIGGCVTARGLARALFDRADRPRARPRRVVWRTRVCCDRAHPRGARAAAHP